jgi:hypothetical protein
MHTVEPYRSDAYAAVKLEEHAAEMCRQTEPVRGVPEKIFVTDGCSVWIDGSWADCCVDHDVSYWCGGSRAQRKQADRELDLCVSEDSSGFIGSMMYMGVRMGGHPIWPTTWRWGFGRDYPAGYDEPAAEDEAESEDLP